MAVHREVTPSIKFAGTRLYSWVETGSVRVEYLAREHNTGSLTRAGTRTTQSGNECTNHEATVPSHYLLNLLFIFNILKLCVIILRLCDVLQGMSFVQISIWTQTINPKDLALYNLKQRQRPLMQSVSFSVKKVILNA